MGQKRKKSGIKWYNSILSQVIAVNVIMAVVFGLVMFATMDSLDNSVNMSSSLMSYIANVNNYEGKISAKVYFLYSQPFSYMYTDREQKQNLGNIVQQNRAEITKLVTELMDELGKNRSEYSVKALGVAQQLSESIDQYVNLVDQAYELAKKAQGASCAHMMETEVKDQLGVVEQDLQNLNYAVEQIATGSIYDMIDMRNGAVVKIVVGLLIFVVCILATFFMNYFLIIRKISSMSNEVNRIIDEIDNGQGDLTSRIMTSVDSELIYFKKGFNRFIETLQTIMREIREGTLVLATSEEEVSMKIQKANDNVSNTSAALEELSASMENVSHTANNMLDKLEDVKRATQSINDEVYGGQEAATEIKVEASNVRDEANLKKSNTGAKMEGSVRFSRCLLKRVSRLTRSVSLQMSFLISHHRPIFLLLMQVLRLPEPVKQVRDLRSLPKRSVHLLKTADRQPETFRQSARMLQVRLRIFQITHFRFLISLTQQFFPITIHS